ncbi:MAG: acetate/propionate family kinase [Isosphaeraceae bacterium]
MADRRGSRILTINSGSSSLKFALFEMGGAEVLRLVGKLEGIGLGGAGRLAVKDGEGNSLVDEPGRLDDHEAALSRLFDWLKSRPEHGELDAIGHRVVHGGSRHTRPERITPEVMVSLHDLVPLAPDHLPQEIRAIEAVGRAYPDLAQVACFDTAFHRTMPAVAQAFGLPRDLADEGVFRYGFHGLSYEYIVAELRREAGPAAAGGRVIVAHLGNGASMAAIVGGKSVDTTMGFTPAGGLVMSTRSGDLDPGILVYLLRHRGLDAEELDQVVNKRAGLLGVSGTSADMRELLEREEADPRAAEAVALFCRQARKFVGALAAALGGLDTLIFTAGIGENAPPVRRRICEGLEFLGVRVDLERNERNDAVISPDGAAVAVRVMRTDEERMIARHTREVVREQGPSVLER